MVACSSFGFGDVPLPLCSISGSRDVVGTERPSRIYRVWGLGFRVLSGQSDLQGFIGFGFQGLPAPPNYPHKGSIKGYFGGGGGVLMELGVYGLLGF